MVRSRKLSCRSWKWVIPAFASIALLLIIRYFYPVGVDWKGTFSRVDDYWRAPYELNSFRNPPWVLAVLPHAVLPVIWGNSINFFLNITMATLVVYRSGGNWKGILLVFTSPFLLDLARTNNIDWIPMLGLLLPHAWGLPFIAAKPQGVGGIVLLWFKRMGWRLFVPLALVIVFSLLVWGLWPLEYHASAHKPWNFAPFPYFLPLGGWLLLQAWRTDDEVLAAAATPFLVPYYAPYSVTGLLALLAGSRIKSAFYLWLAAWFFVIVESRRVGLLTGW